MEFPYFDTRSPAGWRVWDLVNADVTERGVVVARGLAPEPIGGSAEVVDGKDEADSEANEAVDETIEAVDIDVDGCGDLHVLDASGHVHRFDVETDSIDRLSCFPESDGLTDPRGLCVTGDTIYLVGGEDRRMRAFSTELLQLRWVTETAFDDPVDLVHDGRGVAVLDRGTGQGDGRLVRLDEAGAVASVVSGLVAPTAVTVDPAGNRYVLDVSPEDGGAVVRTLRAGDLPSEDGDASNATAHRLGAPLLGATGIVAVSVNELLVPVDRDDGDAEDARDTGDGTTLYRWRFGEGSSETVDSFDRGCSSLVASPGRACDDVEDLYAIDDESEANAVYRLVRGGKRRRNERTSRFDAQLTTRLDAGDRGTRWHRVKLDRDLGGGDTQVRLSYYATEDDTQVATSRDLQRIDGIGQGYESRLRDADVSGICELASFEADALAERVDVSATLTEQWIEQARELRVDWRPLGEPNPADALLETAEGRYLWVKITLIGNERASPRVSAIRTYFPRRSPLRHLPSVYRQDRANVAFLDRFLSLFGSLFTDVEEEIEGVTRYMDPEGIPAEHLSWLGGWLALDTDESWPEPASRELLSRAPELYKMRGTRAGLLAILRIYLRHSRHESAWREALDIDPQAVLDIVRERARTEAETKRRLGEHEALRTLIGHPGLRHMIVAWSRVLDRQRETVDAMVTAGAIEDEAEDKKEHVTPGDLIRASDEGSLRHVVEYATVLGEIVETLERDAVSKWDVETTRAWYDDVEATRERYEHLIRVAADRTEPALLEGSDLDCIGDEEVREPYADLVDHERGFAVLAGPSVGGDRMRAVRRIVESEQPAHAAGSAVDLRPWIQLGGHSYLGINSHLSKRELVLDRSSLGDDAVLDTREAFAQLGVKSRLDRDSFIS